jgi:hypothetical protein
MLLARPYWSLPRPVSNRMELIGVFDDDSVTIMALPLDPDEMDIFLWLVCDMRTGNVRLRFATISALGIGVYLDQGVYLLACLSERHRDWR